MCSGGLGELSVEWDRPEEGGQGGVVRFYKSQCKSRDKYYLLFEEKALEVPTVQRGRSRFVWNTSSGSFKGKRVRESD